MDNQLETKIAKRQLRSSYITTTISIALVLFLVGIIGLLWLNTNRLSVYVKENMGFTVLIKDNVRAADIKSIEKRLAASPFVKSVNYVSKEAAAEIMKKELGEDFVDFLGFNPLLASIEVKLYANHATPLNITNFQNDLMKLPEVKEVDYQKDRLAEINKNIQKVTLIIAGFCLLLLFIAVALINNTIRLAIYSKRFIIRTMQLVGATSGYIRKPFILSSIFYGFLGSIIAIFLLSGLIFFTSQEFKGFIGFEVIDLIAILFLAIIVVGVIISMISTYFAVSKYLNVNTDKLYM